MLTQPLQRPRAQRPELSPSSLMSSALAWPMAARRDARDPGDAASQDTTRLESGWCDWGLLLNAVSQRLRTFVEPFPAPSGAGGQDAQARTQAGVLECAAALDQLHALLTRQTVAQRQLEEEMNRTRAALARARSELAGTAAATRLERHQALHDGLTALPNLHCLQERLETVVARASGPPVTLTLLHIALDGLPAVNDIHGHRTGDELLRIVAARLSRATRANDLVCRIGGGDFACLLTENIQHDDLQRLAAKLFDTVAAPVLIDSLRLAAHPSMGIASCTARSEGGAALLEEAHRALSLAKEHRSARAFFNEAARDDRPAQPVSGHVRVPFGAP